MKIGQVMYNQQSGQSSSDQGSSDQNNNNEEKKNWFDLRYIEILYTFRKSIFKLYNFRINFCKKT